MARLATTTDVFNAIAEPQRRAILAQLAGGASSVNELADKLAMRQPQASKHLKVLREVGLVGVREAGRERLYSLNGAALRPVHEWVARFEHLWNERFDRLDAYLRKLQSGEGCAEDRPAKDASTKKPSAKQLARGFKEKRK